MARDHAVAAGRARKAVPPGLDEQEFDTWLRAIDPETAAPRAERLKLQVLVVGQGRHAELAAGVALGEYGCQVKLMPAQRLDRALSDGQGFDVVVFDQAVPSRQARSIEQICDAHTAWPILIRNDLAELEELVTQVTSLPDRAVPAEAASAISAGTLRLDLVTRTLLHAGLKMALTRNECNLLAYLMRNTDTLISHRMLFRAVWGYVYTHRCELVQLHVKRLRSRINWDHSGCRLYIASDLGFVLAHSG